MLNKKGLTLIELILVIVIISILIGIAGVLGSKLIDKQTINKETYLAKTFFDNARRMSILKGIEKNEVFDNYSLYGLCIDNSSNSLSLLVCETPLWPPPDNFTCNDPAPDNFSYSVEETIEFRSRISVNFTKPFVVFNKKGVPNRSGTLTLRLKSFERRVILNPSGKTRIEQ